MVAVFLIFVASASATYAPVKKCGVNEMLVPCRTVCPPQFCNNSYTSYGPCGPQVCEPGCDCIEDYLRDNEGLCVLNDNCPPPPTVTESPPTESPPPSNTPCKGSKSSATASSAANAQSSGQSGSAATSSSSASSSSSSATGSSSSSSYASATASSQGSGKPKPSRSCTNNRCTPTCSLPNPPNCPQNSNPCNCPSGTIISDKGGQCVQTQECQKYINCKGDFNASYTDCPIACPSTCAKPDAEYCNTQCGKLGCECNPGYILSENNGKCIQPDDCPGGYPCKQNETFVGCLIRCPNIYCPVDDSRAILICDPARPCPSGCGCKRNYKRKSVDEYICIHASDCPPVNCTRPNEKWNSCPEPCFSDSCSDRNKVTAPGDCPSSGPDCEPQCVCEDDFYRNADGICVTAQECPQTNQ